jgi:hypothetical protein
MAGLIESRLDRIPSMELAPNFVYEPEPSRELNHDEVVLAMMQGPLHIDVVFDPAL